MKLLGVKICMCSDLPGEASLFSKLAISIFIAISSVGQSPGSTSLPVLVSCVCIGAGRGGVERRCKIISHYGCDLYFPSNQFDQESLMFNNYSCFLFYLVSCVLRNPS